MTDSTINYFINANSATGFASFYNSNFGNLNNVIRLNGYPSAVVSEILSGVCVKAQENGFRAELVHNCLDNSMEGVIIPERNVGIINFPLYDEEKNNIEVILKDEKLRQTQDCLLAARKHFAKALSVHDSWEKIYISNMDFEAANKLTDETIEKLIGKKTLKKRGVGIDRFFGASTMNGALDYIQNLTANVGKRYFIKGRPGTGKSTFLKRIAGSAVLAGFTVEIYHCAFDPNSLDMVILRELDLCIFDSTAPHEHFPSRANDEVIDIYKIAVTDKTDEKYHSEIATIMADYKKEADKATEQFSKAKQYYDEFQRKIFSEINGEALEANEREITKALFEK